MSQRDPNKSARNKTVEQMKQQLRTILPDTLLEVGRDSEASLNAFIGSKTGDFINTYHDVIRTPDEYITKWLEGLEKGLADGKQGRWIKMYEHLKNKQNKKFREYTELFLRRSFLKHYDEYARVRPKEDESEIWFGLNDADYGLLITPWFHDGKWRNDRSEIRVFPEAYWTIGHVLKTGVCIDGTKRPITFSNISDLLSFMYAQIRLTKSHYQIGLYDRYIEYVERSANPLQIPFLIPELRYNSGKKHQYRLDFLVINPYTMDKIGIELSPWSTHGKFSGTSSSGVKRTINEMNDIAKESFEKDAEKTRSYFKKYNIVTLTYTDKNLGDLDGLFAELLKFLNPSQPPAQLSLHLIDDYFKI